MKTKIIQNHPQLELSEERKLLLDLAEHGLAAIDTRTVIKKKIRLKNGVLWAGETFYEIKKYKKILVIGFGKTSGQAALALEEILGNKITGGAIISLKKEPLKYIKNFVGTHPLPSLENVAASKEIGKLIANISADDLVICLVSGGGSALLCWDEEELTQSIRLYNEFLKIGQDIKELNLVRKHISKVKGGGLAKMLYPSRVLSLIFGDVPGSHFELVASGPTYPPNSSMYDAKQVLEKYGLGGFRLFGSATEEKYFQNLYNLPVVSVHNALSAMRKRAEELGYKAKILLTDLVNSSEESLQTLRDNSIKNEILLSGAEIRVVVTKKDGTGGRCQYLGMTMLKDISQNETLAAVASDGLDNSDSAGVIVDYSSKLRAENLGLEVIGYLENFKGYDFFSKLGHEQIFTGPTGSNVSDFVIYLNK